MNKIHLIIIGSDRLLFEKGSKVRGRASEYASDFASTDVIVFAHRRLGFYSETLHHNFAIHPTNSKSRGRYLLDSFRIAREILSRRAQGEKYLVSVQDPFETGIVGLALKLLCRVPLHIQLHTDFLNKNFALHSWSNALRVALGIINLSFADGLRTVSARSLATSASLAPGVEAMVLPVQNQEPVRVVSYRSESHKAGADGLVFLSVCRLEKEKDIKTAFIAFKKYLDSGCRGTYRLVGNGRQEEELKALAVELGIEPFVEFCGWDHDPWPYYQSADVYISTSLFEGYGMSIVEAARAGLVLIISDTGVAGELFVDGESALVFKPRDTEGLWHCMQTVFWSSDLRSTLSSTAQEVVQKGQLTFDEYKRLYSQNLARSVTVHGSRITMLARNIFVRYVVSGCTAAFTQIAILYIFTDLAHIWYLFSSMLAFVVALAISFTLQKFWTFQNRSTGKMHNQFIKYTIVGLVGLALNSGLMYLFVDILYIHYILSQILVGFIIMFFNFVLYKFLIFK